MATYYSKLIFVNKTSMIGSSRKICNFLRINQITLLSVRTYVPRRAKEPGISKRLQDFREDFKANLEDPEYVDTLEPDFMTLHEKYNEHVREEKFRKERTGVMIVGRKYFHEKTPNFLTYSEKEQIRTLHEKEPDKWTIEALSESFPADPYVIKLILKSNWTPRDTKRIQKHDESVKRNWEQFKEGKIKVEPMLESHLKKFAFRDLNQFTQPVPYRKLGVQVPKPVSSEFSRIITTCKKYADKKEEVHDRPIKARKIESKELRMPEVSNDEEVDSYKLTGNSPIKITTKKSITFEELRQLSSEIKSKTQENEDRQRALSDVVKNLNVKEIVSEKESKPEDSIALSAPERKIIDSLEIAERITIPKRLWRKGSTYKKNDCFYDDDGEFLYRVPGLISKAQE